MMLHVTNGDAVLAELGAAAGVDPAEVVVWRDVLHDGPVPAGLGPDELARVRAAFLASQGWGNEGSMLAALRERDARLAAHDGEVVLWFEDDLYDALQLAQVSDRLAGRDGIWRVRMPHPPGRDLRAALAAREPFIPSPDAFAALTSPDPRAWAGHFDRLLEELPDTRTGLSRLEREALEALADGPLAFGELFARVSAREQPPWLGDDSLAARLDGLAPLVEPAWRITEQGRAVLEGRAVREPHDHWIGGAHLPGWGWDAARGEAVRR